MFYRPRRRPSAMQATIRAMGADKSAKLQDVSETGIRASVKGGLPEGASVTLVTPRFQVAATVRWSRGDTIGLTLTRKLSAGEQTELSGRS